MNKKENIIIIPQDIIIKTKVAAEAIAKTTKDKHQERGHDGDSSPINHFNGMLGEWAFHYWASKQGGECTKPDLNVYPAHKKSYKEDLLWKLPENMSGGETIKVHVKSQNEWSYNRYGNSYVFTKTDRINQMTGPDDYVALTYIHDYNKVEILQIVKGILLIPFFKLPKEKKYHNTKRAIYCNDFKDLVLL